MHTNSNCFNDGTDMINWLKEHDVKHLPRQLDKPTNSKNQFYNNQQVKWFKKLYQSRSHNVDLDIDINQGSMTAIGRSCCGGRQICTNQQYHQRLAFVENSFTNWYCSVDNFFLYVKQVTGEVFVNKDCKMNYNSEVGPIGNLSNVKALLELKSSPIQCKKLQCFCGLCAPKAADLDTYNTIMRKYAVPNSNLL